MINMILPILVCLTCVNISASVNAKNRESIVASQKKDIIIDMDSAQVEADKIYSLLAYAVVYKDWQEDDRHGRGYNVGAILVSPEGEVVASGLNSVNSANNSTQHGELKVMTHYLDTTQHYNLEGYTIYTTLEPCAMCAGMMVMTAIRKSVNGQNDKYYSKALERLSFDSQQCGGYPAYPRIVLSELTPINIAQKLESAYNAYIEKGSKAIITKFLSTPEAKDIFALAYGQFLQHQVKYPENQDKYLHAKKFLKTTTPQ